MSRKTFSDLRVLVTDPVPNMTQILAEMLRAIGIRGTREVHTTTATMTELKRANYDVLLLDDGLRVLDSVTFVKRLRACADCANRNVPVIMMSASPGPRRIASARDAGVTEFLRKPFAVNHLEQRLTSIMAAPREFIVVDGYAGPDRRRRAAGYDGEDRRSALSDSARAGSA